MTIFTSNFTEQNSRGELFPNGLRVSFVPGHAPTLISFDHAAANANFFETLGNGNINFAAYAGSGKVVSCTATSATAS